MKKNSDEYDVVIVGSGAAGGTLFFWLSKLRPDLRILLLEKGGEIKPGEDGNFWPFFLKYYRNFVIGSRSWSWNSRLGTVIYAGEMLGGTTPISCGNLVWSDQLEEAFYNAGVDLSSSSAHAKAEDFLGVKSLLESRIIAGSKLITQAAEKAGYGMSPMPKGVGRGCDNCGNCVLSCHQHHQGGKKDIRSCIQDAFKHSDNVTIKTLTAANRVLFSSDKAVGVEVVEKGITKKEIRAKIVVLSAGGLSTPKILLNSGEMPDGTGEGLTIHPFEVVYGYKKGAEQLTGMSMASYYKLEDGVLLSPFVDQWSQAILACGLGFGIKNMISTFSVTKVFKNYLGIMVKVKDLESRGGIGKNGRINYRIPAEAIARLDRGDTIAKKILREAGATNIFTTSGFHRGSHPSCTTKVGAVLNLDLSIKGYENLFVSDASSIPVATGTPPILTLTALNIYLAETLAIVL